MNNQTKLTLYGITNELDALDMLLESVTDEKDSDAALELQNQVTDLLQNKLDNCHAYNQSLTDSIELIEKREEELAHAKKVLKNKQKRFKEYLLFCMDRIGVTEIKGKMAQIKIGAASQSVEIENEAEIPPIYIRRKVTNEVDKKSISETLKNGGHVPGANLVFGERRLSFKIKN